MRGAHKLSSGTALWSRSPPFHSSVALNLALAPQLSASTHRSPPPLGNTRAFKHRSLLCRRSATQRHNSFHGARGTRGNSGNPSSCHIGPDPYTLPRGCISHRTVRVGCFTILDMACALVDRFQRATLAIFSCCLALVLLRFLLLATSSGDSMSVPLLDPPSGRVTEMPDPVRVGLVASSSTHTYSFSFSLHPSRGQHPYLGRCYRFDRGSALASSPFGVFATLPHLVSLFWPSSVVVFVLPPGRIVRQEGK